MIILRYKSDGIDECAICGMEIVVDNSFLPAGRHLKEHHSLDTLEALGTPLEYEYKGIDLFRMDFGGDGNLSLSPGQPPIRYKRKT